MYCACSKIKTNNAAANADTFAVRLVGVAHGLVFLHLLLQAEHSGRSM